ncbi:MAG: ribonuclease III [Alphaproteobacteria bacterium]|nr:ribonuclease III [Alphaproteobacteria bacterium]
MADKDLSELEKRIGYRFAQSALLIEALTHQSAAKAREKSGGNYERMEFLGDRVLGLVIADMLYDAFGDDVVGDLARRHAELVRAETLTGVARTLELGAFIRLSPGEKRSGAGESASILADVMEAVLAAVYLDGGLEAARALIEAHWWAILRDQGAAPREPKTHLQEWTQGRGLNLPEYTVTDRAGPAHAPTFTVELRVTGQAPVTASGPNKRAAETKAAAAMLAALGIGS